MRIFLAGLLASQWVLFFPGRAEAEPQMMVNLEPSQGVKIGEGLHFVVQLTWKSTEGEYRFLRPQLVLENLTVETAGEANETFQKDGEEWKKKSFRFELKPVRTGQAKIQPFRINYLDSSQQKEGHLEAGALEISVFPDYTKFYQWGLIAGGILGGGILGSWILRKRMRKKHENDQRTEPILEDQTLSRLKVNHEGLFEAGRIFRAYVDEKFSLSGGTDTSREILLKMESKIPSDEMKTLKRIFDTLEEQQYSGSGRSLEELGKLYSEMIRYIEGKKII